MHALEWFDQRYVFSDGIDELHHKFCGMLECGEIERLVFDEGRQDERCLIDGCETRVFSSRRPKGQSAAVSTVTSRAFCGSGGDGMTRQ